MTVDLYVNLSQKLSTTTTAKRISGRQVARFDEEKFDAAVDSVE